MNNLQVDLCVCEGVRVLEHGMNAGEGLCLCECVCVGNCGGV